MTCRITWIIFLTCGLISCANSGSTFDAKLQEAVTNERARQIAEIKKLEDARLSNIEQKKQAAAQAEMDEYKSRYSSEAKCSFNISDMAISVYETDKSHIEREKLLLLKLQSALSDPKFANQYYEPTFVESRDILKQKSMKASLMHTLYQNSLKGNDCNQIKERHGKFLATIKEYYDARYTEIQYDFNRLSGNSYMSKKYCVLTFKIRNEDIVECLENKELSDRNFEQFCVDTNSAIGGEIKFTDTCPPSPTSGCFDGSTHPGIIKYRYSQDTKSIEVNKKLCTNIWGGTPI